MSLKGKIIAITRPEKQTHKLARLVSKLGGKPYVAPTVEIKPPLNRHHVTKFVNKVLGGQIDFVIFMSVNGVTSLTKFLEEPEQKRKFFRELNKATIVAIGPKTRKELENHGIKADIVPLKYSSEGIVESLRKIDLRGKTGAIPRSSDASKYLRQELEKMGASILEVPIYESTLPQDKSKVLTLLSDLFKGRIDAITFTSASTAQNLFKIASEHAQADELRDCLKKTVVAAIGPTTQRTLEKLGLKVDVVPKEYTIEAMMEALECYMCMRP